MSDWTPPDILGFSVHGAHSEETQTLFDSLAIPILDEIPTQAWVLHDINNQLSLRRADGVDLTIDFTAGKTRHRSQEAGHGAAVLKRALGVKAFSSRLGRLPKVLDATGGWGQDAWAIASLGCSVTVIEQHPIVNALLSDALKRADLDAECAETSRRITLLEGNANGLMPEINADVIYLDPMYPERHRKKAHSKKGMQFLQSLLGPSDEQQSTELLYCALSTSAFRVTVKRPKGAARLGPPAQWKGQQTTVASPNTRFDIYLANV